MAQHTPIAKELPVRQLFQESNIDPYDYDKYARVLGAVLKDHGLLESDVLAVSQTLSLLVVFKTGVVYPADERGVFKKRVDTGSFISFDRVAEVIREEVWRKEVRVTLKGDNSKPVLELAWHTGGPVEPSAIAEESNRIYNVLVRAARDR